MRCDIRRRSLSRFASILRSHKSAALLAAAASVVVNRAYANLTIVPTFAANIISDSNSAAIQAAINSAIAEYSTRFSDTQTVNITFQEGGGLGGSSTPIYSIAYSTIRSALASHSSTTDDNVSLATLPVQSTSPVDGQTNMWITQANARNLGIISNTGTDCTITLNTSLTTPGSSGSSLQYSLRSVAQHEIDEALALGSGLNLPTGFPRQSRPMDLFRYSSTHVRSYTTSGDDAYFSINGTANILRFNQSASGDFGDFWSNNGGGNGGSNPPARVQDAFAFPGTNPVLNEELIGLDVLGFHRLPVNWTNAAGGSWQTAGNWLINPVSSDSILFNLGSTYSITSSSAVTCEAITQTAGTVNLTLNSAATLSVGYGITIGPGTLNLSTNTNAQLATGSVTVNSSGALNFNAGRLVAGALTVNSGGRVSVAAGGDKVLRASSVSVNSGTIDLNDNDMIVGNATAKSTVELYVKTARNGGGWNVAGITSTSAKNQAAHVTGLGVLSGAEYSSVGSRSSFDGIAISSTDTLIKYTWNGDTDFNGVVNFDDYAHIDNGFLHQGDVGFIKDWFNGDLDYSGTINFDDYALIDAAFNAQSGTLRSAIALASGESGVDLSAPGVAEVAEHLQQFGPAYASAFIAAVPEPVAMPCILLAVGYLGNRRSRRGGA